MAREPVLEVRHLNSYYRQDHSILGRKGPRRQILKDVTFDIGQGEILGLVGESGCGKTTLSRTILGCSRTTTERSCIIRSGPRWSFRIPSAA